MSRMNKVLMACVALLISASVVMAIPASDGSLFTDDFGTGDLSKWIRVDGETVYDGAVGNPAGSIYSLTNGGNFEGAARPDMGDGTGLSETVTEFDIKVSGSSGGGFLIFAAYTYVAGTGVGSATDIEIQIAANDWVPDFYGTGQHAWDYHLYDANWNLNGVTARLRADQWHHFKIHRKSLAGPDNVDLYVDDAFVGTYDSLLGSGMIGDAQIGDTSTGPGVGWGDVHWDNFLIYEPWQGYCGDDDHPVRNGDVNEDCRVDYNDLLILTENWLLCDDPTKPECFN